MKRRALVHAGAQSLLLSGLGVPAIAMPQGASSRSAPVRTLHFGTTPVFLDDQAGFLARWGSYLTEAIGVPVQFVQRRTYRDIMGMLRTGELDAAWICGYPWVVNRSQLRGLAIPLYHGELWYQSYLIVPSKDQTTHRLQDLRDRTYAYSDPDSNSGYLVPRTTLIRHGIDPDRHFGRSFFTWGHRNVVRAVAAGLSDGGSVDGYVWDTLQRIGPALVEQTRVAWRSERYGFPPIVVRASLPADSAQRLQNALIGMSMTAAGKQLLAELNLTAFGTFMPEVFDGIAQLAKEAGVRIS